MQLLFVFVERDNEEVGEPVANYFGITGQETTVIPRGYWHNGFDLTCLCYHFVNSDCIRHFVHRFLHTLGMKMLRNFSLMVRCHWTPSR